MTVTDSPTEVIEHKIVAELPEELLWVDTHQEAQALIDSVGGIAEKYDRFFADTEAGEYTEVWGIHGHVAYDTTIAYRLI